MKLRDLLWLIPLVAVGTPASGQDANSLAVPNLSGAWSHPALNGLELPIKGPGPVRNRARQPDGVGNRQLLVGDYTNPILQPWAASIVKKFGDMSLAGKGFPTPRNQCWPEQVPFVFANYGMQLLQQKDKVTILYPYDHQYRQVRMNQPHPEKVTPSWYGDSVGHYEGDTLVVDTVGQKVGPFSMIDWFGTPFTEGLHVVERYRLLDYTATMKALERDAKEHFHQPNPDNGTPADPKYKGKGLQIEVTIEDSAAFAMPWTATVTFRRPLDEQLELVCAENKEWFPGVLSAIPVAEKPDF